MFQRLRARWLNARGSRLKERGQYEKATTLFRRAAELVPSWSAPRFNLGLLFKEQGDWAKSLFWNQQATRVEPNNEGAWWNLGIAATALKRWDVARQAWRGLGIAVPDGDGPIDFHCGFGPIRLNPRGDAEVVWANRIDPARAILASVPFPETGHRWHDIVLHDGAPAGYRHYQGKEVPVFDELVLLESSPYGTYVARVTMAPGSARVVPESAAIVSHDERIIKLAHIAAHMGGCIEDWTTMVHILCKACSEGRPHSAHDSDGAAVAGTHTIGIAATSRDHAQSILHAWERAAEGIGVESFEDGLEPGRA